MSGGWFLIGIAAEMAGMHPQTLRVYERRGLVTPSRSAGNTRRYSAEDVALLRRIQELSEQGLNLAGIERVLELEQRLEKAHQRIRALEEQRADARQEVERVRREGKAEIVHVVRTQTALVPLIKPIVVRKGAR